MTWYLDVGAIQIQAWLARSTDLRGRRGASSMLAELTGRNRWIDAARSRGAVWNAQAGDLDGVVTLVVRDEGELPEVARAVVTELRHALPALGFEASWAEGDSYIAAYPTMEKMRLDGAGLRSLSATATFPAARRCEFCGQSPASTTARRPGEPERASCADCRSRYDAAGHIGKPTSSVAKVLTKLKDETGRLLTIPGDMEQLAACGRTKHFDASTRIATIFADGNAVGAFLHRVAMKPTGSGPDKATIVTTIDAATKAAFVHAVMAHAADRGAVGVIPHVVGGDDLVLSTSARYAWDVVRAFIEIFADRVSGEAQGWGALKEHLPTMSAGVVLHHHSHPIDDAIHLAARCLKDAKTGLAKRPAVAYLDLDQDDPEDVRDADMDLARRSNARSLQWLSANWPSIASLARRATSLRSNLEDFARLEEPAQATMLIRETCRRFGLGEVTALLGDDTAGVGQLTDLRWALQIARDLPAQTPAMAGGHS